MTNHGIPAPVAVAAARGAGAGLGFAQGLVVAYVGIPSFVVTLAGLLGFQGLMLKILGQHGAINMRDPAIRALTTFGLPVWLGWTMAFLLVAAVAASMFASNRARRRRGLDLASRRVLLGRLGLFGRARRRRRRHAQRLSRDADFALAFARGGRDFVAL